jgi:pimeloyl-[acyl-carrier protein] methyl ester esterase
LKELKIHVLECPAPSESVLSDGLQILKEQDLRAELAALTCPMLVLLGRRDSLVPVAVAAPLADLSPHLQVDIIQQAGHTPFLSHPMETLQSIRHFVSSHT